MLTDLHREDNHTILVGGPLELPYKMIAKHMNPLNIY